MKRNCHECGREYEYEAAGNLMLFCPHCSHLDLMDCDIMSASDAHTVYASGNKVLATLTASGGQYRLTSSELSVDTLIGGTYTEALMEAGRLIWGKL